jgi:Domain of unknown function (DUF4124)
MRSASLMRWVLLACAVATAAPLHAQTFKWVDEKGVTHYSDKPPPGERAKAQIVEDRLSVVASDPALAAASAAMRAEGAHRTEAAEAEWLQRQRLMLAAQSTPYFQCPYRVDCDSPFGYAYVPFIVVRGVRLHRAPLPRAPRPAPMRMHRL